jgi:hypothetical protein
MNHTITNVLIPGLQIPLFNETMEENVVEGFSLPSTPNSLIPEPNTKQKSKPRLKNNEIEYKCREYGIIPEPLPSIKDLRKILSEYEKKMKNEEKEKTKKMIENRIKEHKEKRNDPNREKFIPTRLEDSPIQQEFNRLILIMNENVEHMRTCHYEMHKINKCYPSRKNENKMVFGKLAERALYNAWRNKIGIDCTDLDNLCNVGSEYKNDFKIGDLAISQKTTKNKTGDIIMINTYSTLDHGDNLNIDLVLCVIETGKIYFIPHDIVDEIQYVEYETGRIVYKNAIKKFIETDYPQFIYTFPPLSEEQQKNIDNLKEIDLIGTLYESIKS